jgi:hypothetical protein
MGLVDQYYSFHDDDDDDDDELTPLAFYKVVMTNRTPLVAYHSCEV